MHLNICKDCGNEFQTAELRAVRCKTCYKRYQQRKYNADFKKPKAPVKPKPVKHGFRTLGQVESDVIAYNRKHGTNYSYGQYVHKCDRGN